MSGSGTSANFGSLLNQYRHRLSQLQTPDAILTLLNHRDRLHHHLSQSPPLNDTQLTTLLDLDEKLKAAADPIDTILSEHDLSLEAWRKAIPHHSDQWWWHLDEQTSPHSRDRFDGAYHVLTATGWVVNLSLALEIATRFFSSGAGIPGAITIIGSSLLAVLQARGDIPDQIEKRLQKQFHRQNIPTHWQAEAQLGFTGIVLLSLFGVWTVGLPIASEGYNGLGTRDYRQDDFGSAERNYKRAIAINPDNTLAHYNLGSLYEELQQNEAAKEAYLVAVRSQDYPQAYNNLGRLYILEGKHANAAALLSQGLENVAVNQAAGNADLNLAKVEATLYKNLGWAAFAQELPDEAQAYLETALTIAADAETEYNAAINTGAAHCLMAQLVTETEPQPALEHWQECCEQAALTKPEEYQWLTQARRTLAQENKQCKTSPLGS